MLNIGVLFGGKSGEHEVSLSSGATVLENLDKSRYRVFALGIRKDGSPASPEEARAMLGRAIPGVETPALVIRPGRCGRFLDILACGDDGRELEIDLFFPVLHGTFGEDGTIQGLLEMAEKPFVGCGVLGSSAGMDKEVMKTLFQASGLPIVPWISFFQPEWEKEPAVFRRRIMTELGLPCFVKPARLGSSVGITKVSTENALDQAITEAFTFDYKVIVEMGIPAREIECSVMGNYAVKSSLPGEIIPSRDFYDYSAKYKDDQSQLIIPAELSLETTTRVRALAEQAFRALGAEGFARADFLLDKRDDTLYLSEINTIPGFTAISMFPKLWGLSGMDIPALLDELIRLALERDRWKAALKTSLDGA